MSPLLFIAMVSLILIALLYWIINSLDSETQKKKHTAPEFKWETAPEIVDSNSSEIYMPQNSIKIVKNCEGSITVLWHFPPDSTLISNNAKLENKELILRVYQIIDWQTYFDIAISGNSGSKSIKLNNCTYFYCTIGYKNANGFVPLISSRTIKVKN